MAASKTRSNAPAAHAEILPILDLPDLPKSRAGLLPESDSASRANARSEAD